MISLPKLFCFFFGVSFQKFESKICTNQIFPKLFWIPKVSVQLDVESHFSNMTNIQSNLFRNPFFEIYDIGRPPCCTLLVVICREVSRLYGTRLSVVIIYGSLLDGQFHSTTLPDENFKHILRCCHLGRNYW